MLPHLLKTLMYSNKRTTHCRKEVGAKKGSGESQQALCDSLLPEGKLWCTQRCNSQNESVTVSTRENMPCFNDWRYRNNCWAES
jgi:hypothetical protein